MATKRPANLLNPPKPFSELTEDEEYDEIEDDLYLSPDGTMTTYHEGDEFDENSEWYGNRPKVKIGDTVFDMDEFGNLI